MKTKLFKSMNLIRRGSGASLNLFRYTAMVIMLLTLGVGDAWGTPGGSTTYYSRAGVKVASGSGTVYVKKGATTASASSYDKTTTGTSFVYTDDASSETQNFSTNFAICAVPAKDYRFDGWTLSGSWGTNPSTTQASTYGVVKGAATSGGSSATTGTAAANFVQISIASVTPTSKTLSPTDARTTCGDYTGTVVFTTTNDNAETQIGTPTFGSTTGSGTWKATNDWAAGKSTVTYTFKGNGYYGGSSTSSGSRNNSATLTLPTAGGASSKFVTFTANFPSLVLSDAAENNTAYPINPTSDGTGTVVFPVQYCDGAFDFTATITGASGGTFTLGTISFTQTNAATGSGNITVPFTFNAGGAEGDFSATLTLTPQANTGGTAKSVTIAGHSEAAATKDVSVTTAAGVTTEYETWAAGLTAANASAGSTLKLLRDVDLTGTYGITGTQGITQTMTLDLNGKTLSASIGGSILNPKTAGKTLTIKDSKTGGKIQNITPDYNGVTYGVNISAGSVILESGTIHAENNAVFNHSTLTGLGTRAVKLAANSTFEMKGGMLEAVGGREVYGIYQESSSANNTADKSVVTIKGGTIRAEAPACVYGIRSYGKVNMSDGTIDVIVNTGTVNSNATYVASNFNDNTLHRYGYGIRMYGSASATTANNYSGTLTITGGTINVTNQNKTMNGTTMYNEHIYGINMDVSVTGAGAGKTAPDGTKVQKACAVGSIENATINLNHAGVLGYGVLATGCYNSYNNTYTPLQIKNSTINVTTFQTAYGVYANAYINWNSTLTKLTGNGGCTYGDVELTNVTINATTTGGTGAYCAWASCTSGTVANAKATTGSTSEGNATYYGEYAVAGKITVNSGTFTADAKTSSAYGIGSSDRAKCVRNVNGVFANRDAVDDPQGSLSDYALTSDAEAYPELNIHGGNFSATTGTTTAIAVKSGGNTLIDGGTFNAYAGGSTAYGLYVTAGKTTANGVTFHASATTVAYGVYVYGGISDWSLFPYYGEVELNNCNATAIARTTTDARAVYVNGTTKVYTQASFDAMKTANNSNYQNNGDYAQVGERAFVGKATINGGTYLATAETTTAFGIYMMSTRVSTNKEAIAYNPLVVKNATIAAKTNTSTSAYGVSIGGGGLIENCTITATAGTTTASGVRAIDKTTVIKNSTISAKGTDVVYGLEGYVDASTAHGYCWHGDFDLSEAGTTKVTAESTGATKAYTIFLNAKAINIASGNFAGDYATAANATINGGTYIAKTNGGTSGYTLALTGTQTKGSVSAQPEVLIEDGKFNGATAEIGTAGVAGHVQLKGGYYVHKTNLSTYIPEGYEEFPLPNDRPEYAEGYRYAIEPVGNHGNYVCQIGSTKYKTLEEALQVVKSGQVIYMIANYTMVTPGDYVLPSGATLLIPYKDGTGKGATTAIGNSAETNTSGTTPTLFRKLTFGEGVNLTCFGTIETSAQQKCNGQYGACAGMPSGAYGQIHLEEGSHISLEANSRLNCWGYITGKGTINVKKNATVLEDFQLGDWCGGTNASTLNNNSQKVFPITHYFYQNIECPITYRPGSKALGSSHIYASSTVAGQDAVALVGVSGSGALFLMDNNDESADTWVMKDYDETTDQCVWTMNSGASIGNLNINLTASWLSYNFTSANYDLPITTNMTIILNNGEMGLSQNTVFLPGSKLIVNKQGTLAINGINVVAYDVADWTGTTRYYASYSPTWGTTNPRKNIAVQSAEFFLHGKVNIKSNGGLYTTASGANVHSTNEDAGEVIYTTAAQGNKTSYYLQQGGTTRTALTVNPAKLKNGNGSYAESAGTTSGKTWTYKNDVWDAWSKDGCFFMNAQDQPHAKPAALIQLTSKTPDSNHLHHDAATGTRNFVWDENCYWWEVSTTPTAEGYYLSLNADNNGDYNYYYYDGAANCWKIKKITVTWNVNGTNTNYSVGYGTKPEWLGATPTKSSSSDNYVWRWDGWTMGSDATVLANNDLPYVTENTTFTAHFYEKYYEYNITFKNEDGTILDSRNWRKGDTPSYDGTPTKNPTADKTYEFNGTWSPAITEVNGSATYVAQYDATPRAYTITFLNYDMSPLGSIQVNYGTTPSHDTYKAAIAPSDFEPYKPDNNAYSFVFNGWKLNGADKNGFVQAQGDQTYVAQYEETTKKYRIEFVDDDGETLLHWTQLEYGAMAAYDGPATSGFDKQDVAWNYTFAGWDPATFSEVQGPQTYTATYNRSAREYTITWLNWDGSPLSKPTITSTINYGNPPGYSSANNGKPTRESSDGKTYEWDGWTTEVNGAGTFYSKDSLPNATGDATYYAHFRIKAIDVASASDISIDENAEVTTTTVRVEGKLNVPENRTLTTDDLILEGTPSSSGEIIGEGTVTATRALFDFSQPGGFKARTWYAVAVPWQVDVKAYAGDNGVYIINGNAEPVRQKMGTSFDLIYYDGALRAAEGHSDNCWKYVEDDDQEKHIMYPGRAYMIYLTSDAQTIRFERKNDTKLLTNSLNVYRYSSETGNGTDANWNGIANPATYHAYLNVGDTVDYGQVYNADTKRYELFNMRKNKLVVGQPIFVQPAEEKTIVANAESYVINPSLAPRRTNAQETPMTRYEVMFAPNEGDVTDRIIVRLNEEKEENSYVVGQDLVKMGVSDMVPQMWVDRYDSKMCINTVAPVNNRADYPLGISVQKSGAYDLFIDDQPDDETMLYLTYDGEAIWNLSYGGYVVNLEKGTNSHYGLRIVRSPKVTTDIEEATILNGDAVRKVIVDDKVLIIRNEQIYGIDGRLVK